MNVKTLELDELYLNLEFDNDEDTVKVSMFYFFELALMGRERKRLVDHSLLFLIDIGKCFVMRIGVK